VERIQPHSPGGGFDQTGAQRASVQFDASGTSLTGREHLQLFGSTKALEDKAAVTMTSQRATPRRYAAYNAE
jgi:hypothetical protein